MCHTLYLLLTCSLSGPGGLVGLQSYSTVHNNLKAHSTTVVLVRVSLVPMFVSSVQIDMALDELETIPLSRVGVLLIPVLVCCLGCSGQ